MGYVDEYAYWKMLAWRGLRAGFWGGVVNLTTANIVLREDLSNIKVWAIAIGTAFIMGFGVTVGKYLRDKVSQGHEDTIIDKLPI